MKRIYLLFLATIFSGASFAQLQLKPAIGPTSLPSDNDAVCNIVCSSNYNFDTGGLQIGDTIPQFTFYTLSGTAVDALSLLQTGKPLLLIAGSITCPVYRGKINSINSIISTYGSQINTYIVYVVEAHPNSPDVSPYSCNVWTHSTNISEGVLYLQQTTYGQRKAAVTDMMNNVCSCMPAINAPVIIDGPCNDYWKTFGEAPNNAYLINPMDGTVDCKHGWFNKAPDNMADCIDAMLSVLAVNEQSAAYKTEAYPNPFSDRATIRISGQSQASAGNLSSLNLKLFDVFGNELSVMAVRNADGFEIQKGNLPNGMYFYAITDQMDPVITGKLVIQ